MVCCAKKSSHKSGTLQIDLGRLKETQRVLMSGLGEWYKLALLAARGIEIETGWTGRTFAQFAEKLKLVNVPSVRAFPLQFPVFSRLQFLPQQAKAVAG
jgi:hypothetical protein